MDPETMASALLKRFSEPLLTLDSHTEGEPTRLLVGGLPPIPGATLNAKRLYMMHEMDHIRLLLTREPRGHRDMFAAVLTEPVTPGASFGLIYMDACRYPFLCGHGTIGAVTTLIEAGMIEATSPETVITLDTPAGPMQATAHMDARNNVTGVTIQAVPCFAPLLNQPLDVPGFGTINIDIAFAGGFFAMVSKTEIGLELIPENAGKLAPLGMAIIEAANEQIPTQHPTQPYITDVMVTEFYDPAGHKEQRGLNMVIYGESHVDRSPCGTGTCAKMALLHREGVLDVGVPFINAGILGTTFEGRIVTETQVGDIPAIIPQFRGRAYVTGVQRFIMDPADPFPEGFLL